MSHMYKHLQFMYSLATEMNFKKKDILDVIDNAIESFQYPTAINIETDEIKKIEYIAIVRPDKNNHDKDKLYIFGPNSNIYRIWLNPQNQICFHGQYSDAGYFNFNKVDNVHITIHNNLPGSKLSNRIVEYASIPNISHGFDII